MGGLLRGGNGKSSTNDHTAGSGEKATRWLKGTTSVEPRAENKGISYHGRMKNLRYG